LDNGGKTGPWKGSSGTVIIVASEKSEGPGHGIASGMVVRMRDKPNVAFSGIITGHGRKRMGSSRHKLRAEGAGDDQLRRKTRHPQKGGGGKKAGRGG